MTLYHVAIGYEDKPLPVTTVQEKFGSAGWARYAPNCWIVATSESADTLSERIRGVCSPTDSIFVAQIDPSNYKGYLKKEIWEWLRAK